MGYKKNKKGVKYSRRIKQFEQDNLITSNEQKRLNK